MTVNDFLGNKLIDSFSYVYPILRLICYRLNIRGKEGLFTYDNDYGKKLRIHDIIRYFPKKLMCMSHVNSGLPRTMETIYLSDTIFGIDRYNGMLEEIFDKKDNIIGSLITREAFRSNRYYSGLEKKKWDCRKIYFGDSISGKRVVLKVNDVFDLFDGLLQKQEICDDHISEVFLMISELEQVVRRRVGEIASLLRHNNVKLFITINQYNLRDVLTILACRSLGIKTKQLMHYGLCIDNVRSYKQDNPNERLHKNENEYYSYVDENAYWCNADISFEKKYSENVINVFGEETVLSQVGCPELTQSELILFNNDSRKDIILFVPEYVLLTGNVINHNRGNDIINWRTNIFSMVHELAKKRGSRVFVRYHPGLEFEVEDHVNVIEEYGFIICGSSHDELHDAMSKCCVALGAISGALVLANACGCDVYSINMPNTEVDLSGVDIKVVEVEDIPFIKERSSVEKEQLEKIKPIDIEKLLKWDG